MKGIELLRYNHAGCFMKKGNTVATNYGGIKICDNVFTYWTQKALHYFFGSKYKLDKLKSKEDKWLIDNGYVEKINLQDIERILF